jgi:hypothetical protein
VEGLEELPALTTLLYYFKNSTSGDSHYSSTTTTQQPPLIHASFDRLVKSAVIDRCTAIGRRQHQVSPTPPSLSWDMCVYAAPATCDLTNPRPGLCMWHQVIWRCRR